MLETQIRKLAKALSPNAALPSGWDVDLPKYAAFDLDGTSLVVARCGSKYVVSAVLYNTVRSAVVSAEITDAEISDAVVLFNDPTTDSPRARTTEYTGHHPSTAGGAGVGPSRARDSPQPRTRDPNAPPGFEDEHLLNRPRPAGPSFEFDPDRDLYPPGGPHPQLRAFDPLGSGSGGMTPAPFGSSKPPNIREDPTAPFGGPGHAPFGSSSGSGPFGPGAPFG